MEEVFDKIKEHANKAKDSAVQVTKQSLRNKQHSKPNKIKVFNKRNEKQN